MSNRYVVRSRKLSGTVELADLGAHAQISYAGQTATVDGSEAGSRLWAAMKAAGVNPQSVNSFVVEEDGEDGPTVAHLLAVLEGARVVWLILYRADRAASCFRPIGSRQRIGDALNACFEQIIEDVRLPHKP